MKTTLKLIKAHEPCGDGWNTLLAFLNKTEADDEELDLLTILESNGINHAIWALRTVDEYEKEKRLMACDFAEMVVHLTNDERCKNAIKVSRDFANGLASKEELNDAAASAYYAAYAAHNSSAAAAHNSSAAAAHNSSAAAAYAAAYYAASAAATKETHTIIFKKYCL